MIRVMVANKRAGIYHEALLWLSDHGIHGTMDQHVTLPKKFFAMGRGMFITGFADVNYTEYEFRFHDSQADLVSLFKLTWGGK